MKSYDKMANDVLRRIGEYRAAQKKRKKIIIKASAAVCCVSAALLAGAGIGKGGFLSFTDTQVIEKRQELNNSGSEVSDNNEAEKPVKKPSSEPQGGKAQEPSSSEVTETQETPPQSSNSEPEHLQSGGISDGAMIWNVYCNRIVGSAGGAKLYYDPALYYKKELTSDEAAEYFGRDFTALGEGLKFVGGNFEFYFENCGSVACDTAVYRYNGGAVTLLASRTGMPYDCLYTLESENKSLLYADDRERVEVLAGTDGGGFFFADFSRGGINFRVTAENTENSEFVSIIRAVIG